MFDATFYARYDTHNFYSLRYGGRDRMMSKNQYSFRPTGIIFGCSIILFSAALLSIELGRLYSGSINRGRNVSNDSFQYLIFPDTPINFNADRRNPKSENRWMWPWSTATLLFSLIFLITGAIGITSGQRESYTSILTFIICLILSICLLIFLIATYLTIIAGWKSIYGTYDGNSMPSFVRIDRDLSSVCLAISCILFIILLISFVLAGITIDLCTRKDFPKYERVYGVGTTRPGYVN